MVIQQDAMPDLDPTLREAVRQSRTAACLTDPRQEDNPIVFVNAAFCRLTGYDEDEVLGRNCRFLQGKDTDEAKVREIRAAIEAGHGLRIEVLNYKKDGSPFWNDLRIDPIRDESGELRLFFGAQEDASARVHDRRALEDANAELRLLRTALSAANDAVLVTEPDPLDEPGPRIVYASKGFERMTGYRADEVKGFSPRLMQGPDTSRAELERIRTALAAGHEVEGSLVNYKKDGTPFWIEWTIVPVHDDAGRRTNWVAVQHDVTERVKSRQSHDQRLEQQEIVAEFAQKALDGFERQALLTEACRAIVRGLDCPFAKVLVPVRGETGERTLLVAAGVGWDEGVVGHATIGIDDDSPAGHALRTGQPVVTPDLAQETRFSWPTLLRAHGAVSAVNVLIEGNGKPFGVLEADSRDARYFNEHDMAFLSGVASLLASALERRQAEEEREFLMAELDHRVKNMLARVQAIAQRSDDEAKSKAQFRESLVARLGAMAQTHDLLTRSRWRGVDLRQIWARELAPYRTGDNLRLEGPKAVLNPKAALSLSLVAHELATNAAKHGALASPKGRVEVVWRRQRDGGLAILWRESGGAPVEAPVRRGFGSTVIERAFAFETGGQAALRFLPEGVVFDATLPAAVLVEEEALPSAPEASREASGETAAGVALLVEDDYLIATMVGDILRRAGWRVVGPAASVAQGLALVRAEGASLDAAVLDVNLGESFSIAVADALRERGVPFVFASGYTREEVLPERFARTPRLNKPYGEAALLRALGDLGKRRPTGK
ncbi:MAG: PAS domain-containing protein [Geminicoccaceae bacterium]|nr:PAS domain-containing protein [Geminicoccaceae bacterium]